MSFKFFSNLQRARNLHIAMSMNALHAAALVVQAEAKKNAARRFVGGATYRRTGNLVRSIRSRVIRTGMSAHAEIGTHVMYGMYWEVGHHNIFLARRFGIPQSATGSPGVFVRKQWLAPAFRNTGKKQQMAASIAMRKTVFSMRSLFRFRI